MADRHERALRQAHSELEDTSGPWFQVLARGSLDCGRCKYGAPNGRRCRRSPTTLGVGRGMHWHRSLTRPRFEVAILAGADLCALAIGDGVSAGFEHVRWNWVEGWRTPNPLTDRVIQACDFCASPTPWHQGSGLVQVDCPAPGLDDVWEELHYGPLTLPGNYLRPFGKRLSTRYEHFGCVAARPIASPLATQEQGSRSACRDGAPNARETAGCGPSRGVR
jgi:hypothetical protein